MPKNHELSTVARHVRDAREAAGLSQHDLALKSGVTVTTISRTECDATAPLLDTIEKLAVGLGLKVTALLDGD